MLTTGLSLLEEEKCLQTQDSLCLISASSCCTKPSAYYSVTKSTRGLSDSKQTLECHQIPHLPKEFSGCCQNSGCFSSSRWAIEQEIGKLQQQEVKQFCHTIFCKWIFQRNKKPQAILSLSICFTTLTQVSMPQLKHVTQFCK